MSDSQETGTGHGSDRVELTQENLVALLAAARRQFSEDLPDLLESHRGEWVAYRGDRQLTIHYSEFEACKSECAAAYAQEEIRTFWIMGGEDEYEDA